MFPQSLHIWDIIEKQRYDAEGLYSYEAVGTTVPAGFLKG